MGLPPKNIFIPKNFELFQLKKEELIETPTKILETAQSDVWYCFDTQFKLPKSEFFLNIYTNDEDYATNPKSNILADLWDDLFKKNFKDVKYLAERADQKFFSQMKRNRIFINAYGYNDTLHLLIE